MYDITSPQNEYVKNLINAKYNLGVLDLSQQVILINVK